jgi:hypothetical protein
MDGSAEFDEFYRGTANHVVTQVYALTGDLAEAQDCVHEAYARAWQRWRAAFDQDKTVLCIAIVRLGDVVLTVLSYEGDLQNTAKTTAEYGIQTAQAAVSRASCLPNDC